VGYTITIGEAKIAYDPEWLSISIEAESEEHDDAPNHDGFTGKSNSRSPSYTVWPDFCRDAGIYELFYGGGWDKANGYYKSCPDGYHRETPLLAHHPSAQPICKGDLDVIRAARVKREQTNGGRPPGFWEYDKEKRDFIDNGTDSTLARLLWLEFWMDWAIKNCRIPIIENT
jgi:hypothetical protein